jgi:hypothetical protein
METVKELAKLTNAQEKTIISCNALTVIAGTTGMQGGDTSHGSRTMLQLINDGSTDMRASFNGYEMYPCSNITIAFGGDCELETFIKALQFALKAYGAKEETHSDKQAQNFYLYLLELIGLYESTRSLNGMSKIRDKYGVTGITKQQFFEYNLNKKLLLLPEEAAEIYKVVKTKKQ